MPGVYRPQTLADVLNVIQQTAIGNTDTSVSGVGYFAEADDQMTVSDSAAAAGQPNPAWDLGEWGAFSWG